MSVLLKDDRSREPVDFVLGTPKRLRFDGVLLLDGVGGAEVFLTGPVDIGRYALKMFTGVRKETGVRWERAGYGLHAVLEDGVPVDKFWNNVSARARQNLRADLASGSYLKTEYTVTAVGEPPETQYSIVRTPL